MIPASTPVRRFRSHAARAAFGVCLALFVLPVEAQLTDLGAQVLTECAAPGDCRANEFFGAELAAGDFGNDGFEDLAVGVRDETVGGDQNAGAQVSPNGGELQVNSYTTSDQRFPAVASDASGNFVVVWQSLGASGTDTNDWSVQAQRYAANGAALGGEFQVNSYTTSSQAYPAVASDASGNFVVAWHSLGASGTDTSGFSVQAQRYAASGAALGGEFQVNTFTTNRQYRPAVASDASGNFVVAWQSVGSSGTDTSGYSVQAQRYDASGAALGGEFQVNSFTTNYQTEPDVASDASGNFVVAWQSYVSSGTDTSAWSVQAQRYDASGAALGGELQVNSYTTSLQSGPAVASDASGNFVVAWHSYGASGTDTSNWSVQAQRYDANGAALGGEFQVNSYTPSTQYRPAVASDASGNFVVAWHSYGASGTDTSDASVQAQRYAASGAALGGQFQVNSYTTSNQYRPAVASDASGNFVVAWHSIGSSGTDTSGFSVQAQRYDGFFRDGFETGDTDRWSAAVP